MGTLSVDPPEERHLRPGTGIHHFDLCYNRSIPYWQLRWARRGDPMWSAAWAPCSLLSLHGLPWTGLDARYW